MTLEFRLQLADSILVQVLAAQRCESITVVAGERRQVMERSQCGPETSWMQTTKEMAHREGSLEHSAIVKSGSALPYFSLLSNFLTTVGLS